MAKVEDENSIITATVGRIMPYIVVVVVVVVVVVTRSIILVVAGLAPEHGGSTSGIMNCNLR